MEITEDILNTMYLIEKKSCKQIADILGYTQGKIYYFCQKFKIKMRANGEDKIGKKAHNNKRVTVKCCNCEKELSLPPCRLKAQYITCSSKCKGKMRSKFIKEENHPNYNKVVINCNYCYKEVRKNKNYIKRFKNQFCCSKCHDLWRSKNIIGESHPSYKGGYIDNYGLQWKSIKKKIRNRDKSCLLCNKIQEDNGNKLSVHHYILFRLFKTENSDKANFYGKYDTNLGLYCSKCHSKIERISRLIWTQDFFNKSNILETSPSLKDKNNNFHCYSVYK